MNRQHIIEEAVFDISFGSEHDARQLGHGMDDFIQNKLLPFVSEVFNEFSTEGMVTRIDLLEIELGDILSSDFHQEIPNRFKEGLRSAIREKLRIISQEPSDIEGLFEVQRTEFEQLKHFLETGFHQEGTGDNGHPSIDEMLGQVLRDMGREFSEFLKSSSRREIVLERLTKQFPESVLIEVLGLLAPAMIGFLPEYLREFDELLKFRALKTDKTNAIRLFLERLLNICLVDRNEILEPEKLFREVADTFFTAGYEANSSVTQTEVMADKVSSTDLEVLSSDTHMIEEDVLRIRLENSLVTGDFSGIAREWIEMLGHPALRHLSAIEQDALPWRYTLSWLRTSLQTQAERLTYMRGLIAGLERAGMDRDEILRAVRHSGPDVDLFLSGELERSSGAGYSDQREGHLQMLEDRLAGMVSDDTTQQIEALSAEHGKDLVSLLERWDAHTSGEAWKHLSEEELRTFSRFLIKWKGQGKSKDFLREMERHVSEAASKAGYYRYVLQKLLRDEAVDLLEAQASEPLDRETDAERSPLEMNKKLLRTERRLSGSVTDDMTRQIEELSAEHGKELASLLERWEVRTTGELWAHLSAGELRALSRFLVQWKGQGKSKVFLREMERHVSEAMSEAGYYRYVLQKLLRNEAIDFLEAVVSEPLDRETDAERSPFEMNEKLLQRLKARLSGTVADDMTRQIEAISAEHGKDLASLLERWDSGTTGETWEHLSASELRALSRFLVQWKGQGKSKDFLREMERHVSEATSEAVYYRYILQKLLRDKAVDLLEASESGAGKLSQSRNEHAGESRSETAMGTLDEIETDIFNGEIQVANAGQVLMAPYLPRLFSMLELTEGGKFKGADAAERAIHIIQFAVNGSKYSPEFQLSLNKLLCGIGMGTPITRSIDLLDGENESIEGMLKAMIQHWSIIGNTSVQGLRESFLQRRGRLSFSGDAWRLRVESKGIDVLLDRLPWSFSVIKYPWMTQPVHVEWR